MNQHSAWKTRESLLEKVKDQTDEQSWEDFVYYYSPFIYSVIRGMNISHHDAEEIVQMVLLKSWNKLPEFEYNRGKGRFAAGYVRLQETRSGILFAREKQQQNTFRQINRTYSVIHVAIYTTFILS